MPNGGAANNTLISYERDLEDAYSFLKQRGVKPTDAASDDLRAYLSHLAQQGFKASSQARRLSALRQFYKFLYAEGLRTDDPTGVLDAPKKGRSLPKVLSIDDVSKLIGQAEAEAAKSGGDTVARLRMHALIELLYATGMRVSELVSLPASVLAQNGRFLVIRGKGNKERMVPLSHSAIRAMQAYGTAMASDNARAEKRPAAGKPVALSLFRHGGLPAAPGFCPRLEGSRRPAPASALRRSRRMCCAMPLPVICLPMAPTFAPCRNFSDIRTFQRHKSIPMCWKNGCISWSKTITLLPNRRKNRIRSARTLGRDG